MSETFTISAEILQLSNPSPDKPTLCIFLDFLLSSKPDSTH